MFILSIAYCVLYIFYPLYESRIGFPYVLLKRKHICSFHDVSACQSINVTNRTFLFIIWGRAGFCSELNQILLAFAYSISTKRRFLIDSRHWNYGNYSDYFNFPSKFNYSALNQTFLDEDNRKNEQVDHLKTTRVGSQVTKFWKATRPVQTIQIKRRAAHYLWNHLSDKTLQFINRCAMKNLSDYIGIHVRRGDKLRKEAREIPLQKYIKSIERILTNRTDIRNIFVASDDRSVIQKLRQLRPNWNFHSSRIANKQVKSSIGHDQKNFDLLPAKEKVFETRLFMCELQMLIDAQYVLCGMSSNVCRLVQILRRQNTSTVISLDRGWYAI